MDKRVCSEPIKRTKLRLFIGKRYYLLKRYAKWYFFAWNYSNHFSASSCLPYLIFTHKTPLIRELKGVDQNLQYNKINNLKIAASKVNHILIRPGEIFSYWRLIGKPSRNKGYQDGLILKPDGTFGTGIGGGLCQLSLIYWMTLHTPLKVIERYRHSHDIFPDSNRTQPFGSGATCVYNYLDLQIYNGTDAEFQLNIRLTEYELIGELSSDKPAQYNYQVYEREHFISSTYWGGYIRNNSIYRKIYVSGELIKDEYITENHAVMMYQPLLPGELKVERRMN